MPARRSLALALSLAACTPEPELATCEVEATPVEMTGLICAVTASGLVLRYTDVLQVDRIGSDGSLTPVVQASFDWPVWGCGTVAEDPASGTIFVTVPTFAEPDPFADAPDRLLRFSPNGELLGSELLEHEGAPVLVESSLFNDGSLWLAGAVSYGESPGDPWDYGYRASLERHAVDGTLEWRNVGYAGWNPLGELHDMPFDRFAMSTASGEGSVAVVGSKAGTDSAELVMLVFRADGSVKFTQLLTPDNYSGPNIHLAGGDGTLFVAEQAQQRVDYWADPADPPPLRPARSIVTAYWQFGSVMWRGEFEWPELRELSNTEAVPVEHAVFNVVSGTDVDDAEVRHVEIARHDWTGAVDCTRSLDELGLYQGSRLLALDDGRLLLLGEVDVATPDDEYPELEVTLTLLRVDPGPWPYTPAPEP